MGNVFKYRRISIKLPLCKSSQFPSVETFSLVSIFWTFLISTLILPRFFLWNLLVSTICVTILNYDPLLVSLFLVSWPVVEITWSEGWLIYCNSFRRMENLPTKFRIPYYKRLFVQCLKSSKLLSPNRPSSRSIVPSLPLSRC